MLDKNAIYAITIVISGFIARLINIKQPLLEVAMWRQCDTASIARNFYYNGMNIFYPQAMQSGTTKGYIGGTEFQIYPFTVAILYQLFGVHESLGRLVSILAFCGGAFFLYKLSKKYVDKTSSLIAWAMNTIGCSIGSIETLRQKGAKYFVTTALDAIDSSVLDYLKDKYETIRSTNEYLIVHLENSTSLLKDAREDNKR